MEDYRYNPFNKPLKEVNARDLQILRNVAEGWYVEYKREPQNIRDSAKALTAFANQYGGMLFIGIREATDGSRTASEFPGIPKAQIPEIALRIREAASAHVSPATYYEERVIEGPCAEIDLPPDRAILIVGIPQGLDPPYVHSSGRIYRRLADQSAPREETDRHILDLLWERGRAFRTKVTQRLRKTPEHLEPQANSAWAFVYLVPDLRGTPVDRMLPFETFRRLASNPSDNIPGVTISLDSVHSRSMGYIGRHIADNDPKFGTLSFHWWHDGVARLDIPLNTWKPTEFLTSDRRYKHLSKFVGEMNARRHNDTDICDFSMIVLSVSALLNLYNHLRSSINDHRALFAAFELRNVLYKVPFFNSAAYVSRCGANGIPIITERTIVFPEQPYFDNMIELDAVANVGDDQQPTNPALVPHVMAAPLVTAIMHATGIVPDIDTFATDGEMWSNHTPTESLPKPTTQ
jgi:hypothetical protein